LVWVGAALALAASAAPVLGAPVKLWQTAGLKAPESALPDPTGSFAYVSNIGGSPTEKDGNGFISKVSLADGKLLELAWAKGLDAPKGMALAKDRLYVSDIDRLVEIDAKTAKIIARYDAAGAKFLNDVAADVEGRIYVSDMLTNTIWRLKDGKLEAWLDTPDVRSPNGLLVKDGNLLVAAWGAMTDGFNTKVPGNLLAVSLADKTVKNLGDGTPVGNLDGLEPLDKSSFLVTDWMAGALYRIDTSGDAELLLDLNQGSADIGWVPDKHLLLIPMMKDDELVAYRLE
jgi:DNA-binding beta-propeller fold protein YncE